METAREIITNALDKNSILYHTVKSTESYIYLYANVQLLDPKKSAYISIEIYEGLIYLVVIKSKLVSDIPVSLKYAVAEKIVRMNNENYYNTGVYNYDIEKGSISIKISQDIEYLEDIESDFMSNFRVVSNVVNNKKQALVDFIKAQKHNNFELLKRFNPN